METGEPRFAVCIQNADYPASLEVRKLYRGLPDDETFDPAQLLIAHA